MKIVTVSSNLFCISTAKEREVVEKMQTLLLRGTKNLTKEQSRFVCTVTMIAVFIVSTVYNWRGEWLIRVDLNALSRPAFETTKTESEIESVYKKGLAIAKLSSLGAMGEKQTQSSEETTLTFEKEIENDVALTAIMNSKKMDLSRIENDIESQIESIKIENMRKRQLESITCDPDNVTKISNMTEEQIGEMVKGTWLEGKESALYQVEQEEGINVFFIYAVSTLESDHGSSYRATTRHNYYGLETSKNYSSYEDNTKYFGDMMNRLYIERGKTSVDDIAPVYCPPNRNWENVVKEIMTTQYEKITTLTLQ